MTPSTELVFQVINSCRRRGRLPDGLRREGGSRLSSEREVVGGNTVCLAGGVPRSPGDDPALAYGGEGLQLLHVKGQGRPGKEELRAGLMLPARRFRLANVNIEDFSCGPGEDQAGRRPDRPGVQGTYPTSSQNLGRQIKTYALFGGLVLALISTVSGLGLASVISRPIFRLRDRVREVGRGIFPWQCRKRA